MYDPKDIVTLEARPAEGYAFANWTGDVSGIADTTQPSVTFTMGTNDRSIVANFTAPGGLCVVTLDRSPTWGGSATMKTPCGSSVTVDGIEGAESIQCRIGTELSLTAVPVEGYLFGGWTGDVSGSDESLQITVDSSKTIVAKFVRPASSFPLGWVVAGAIAAVALVSAGAVISRRRKVKDTPR